MLTKGQRKLLKRCGNYSQLAGGKHHCRGREQKKTKQAVGESGGKVYDRNLTMEKSLRTEVQSDETFMLCTVSNLATGLLYIWEIRKLMKATIFHMMRHNWRHLCQLSGVQDKSEFEKLAKSCRIRFITLSNVCCYYLSLKYRYERKIWASFFVVYLRCEAPLF